MIQWFVHFLVIVGWGQCYWILRYFVGNANWLVRNGSNFTVFHSCNFKSQILLLESWYLVIVRYRSVMSPLKCLTLSWPALSPGGYYRGPLKISPVQRAASGLASEESTPWQETVYDSAAADRGGCSWTWKNWSKILYKDTFAFSVRTIFLWNGLVWFCKCFAHLFL